MEVPHLTLIWTLSYFLVVSTIVRYITGLNSWGKQRNKSLFPEGPRPLPLVGNVFCFFNLRKNPDQTLFRLARRYGALCMLWFGSKPVVIVSSPKAVKDLMDKASG